LRWLVAVRLASSLLIVTALLGRGVARADRGEIVEHTPSTLEPGELRLGVSDVSIGLFGHDLLRRFEVGTRPIAWLPNAIGAPSYDVRAKFELWRDPHLQLAVGAEHMLVDLSPLVNEDGEDDNDARFLITPLEGWVGVRAGRVRFNAGAVYTHVSLRGAMPGGPIDRLGGAVGTSNLQTIGNVELRATRTIHLVLGGRWVPWQRQYAEAGGSEQVGDGGEVSNTTRGEGDLMGLGRSAWAVGGELHMTWEHTNLRLGVEYGNYSLPIINFVTKERGWLPVLDLYWRI